MKKSLLIVALSFMSSASFAAVLNCNDSFSGEDAGRVEIIGDNVFYSNIRTSGEAWELRKVGTNLLNADLAVQQGKDVLVGAIFPALDGVELSLHGRTLICK